MIDAWCSDFTEAFYLGILQFIEFVYIRFFKVVLEVTSGRWFNLACVKQHKVWQKSTHAKISKQNKTRVIWSAIWYFGGIYGKTSYFFNFIGTSWSYSSTWKLAQHKTCLFIRTRLPAKIQCHIYIGLPLGRVPCLFFALVGCKQSRPPILTL